MPDDVKHKTPVVGQRVFLKYPPELGGPNCPDTSVGTVFQVDPDGSFHVEVRPLCYVIRVVPDEFAAAGCNWRPWSVKDGWPSDKVKPKDRKKGTKK